MSEIQSEQNFGRESVEKSLGYMPAVVDMPKDGPMEIRTLSRRATG